VPRQSVIRQTGIYATIQDALGANGLTGVNEEIRFGKMGVVKARNTSVLGRSVVLVVKASRSSAEVPGCPSAVM
jgi:hypothetical protein